MLPPFYRKKIAIFGEQSQHSFIDKIGWTCWRRIPRVVVLRMSEELLVVIRLVFGGFTTSLTSTRAMTNMNFVWHWPVPLPPEGFSGSNTGRLSHVEATLLQNVCRESWGVDKAYPSQIFLQGSKKVDGMEKFRLLFK